MPPYFDYILAIYLVIINIIAFALMGIDKKRARNKEWRISEATLFVTALLFGSLGSNIGMRVFHHKTKHWYFVIFMPLIMVVQVVILAFVLNKF
jgi:uncharacterized membrane protein YsdA (DUF1294 family)